jgi:predicted RNA binding protein YcfA (HicA-like mRNA interferase family)
MRRIPALRPRQVIAALKKAGFTEDAQTGSHLLLKHPQRKRRVPVPIHARDLKRPTVHAIIKQAGLTVDKFLSLL